VPSSLEGAVLEQEVAIIMKRYEFKEQALGQIIQDKAAAHPDRIFLEYEDGSTVSYQQMDDITNKIANGLTKLGLNKGEFVATFLPNSLDSIYLWFGAAKVGIIEVPINLANKGTYLSHILNNSDVKCLIIERDLIDRLEAVQNDISNLQTVIVRSNPGETGLLPKLKFNMVDYSELLNNSSERPKVFIKGSEPQMVIYTSGTTGAAKGVLDCHSMIYLSALEYIETTRATEKDTLFTFLPLFHANARILCIYPTLLLGTKAVIYEKFSASRFLDQIRKHKATMFNSLGAIAQFIYNQPKKPDDGDNPLRLCAAFPMPTEIYYDFEKRFNLKVVEGYGLTELAIVTYNPYDKPKLGSCGKETRSFEVRIVDEDDFPVPPGTVGEIVARGRIPWATALEYQNMPDKTVELVRNHFYHTGDAGYLDEDGYLFFKDRIKDYIRRRGENISSAEIEKVVNSHPKVAESAALGVKSELSEDEVKVAVVLKAGESLTQEDLLDYCSDRMPYFAVPRFVEYVDSLPKTANEKVQKVKLREAGITANTWDSEKAGYKVKK
jgi:crotonobetaine/carnitine-CoA ligase